jgi:hypothetical protein
MMLQDVTSLRKRGVTLGCSEFALVEERGGLARGGKVAD